MNYLEDLKFLEPSLLTNNSKDYRLAYFVQASERWQWTGDIDLWQVWFMCKHCFRLGREIRVKNNATGEIYSSGAEWSSLLNLFSNSVTDRNGKDTE
ncbi:hypothetical protein ES703_90459 [subsurface metagenome]